MDRKRRVALTIRKERADRPPRGELCIDDAVVSGFLGVTDVAHPDRVEFASRLDLDLICLPADYGLRGETHRLPSTDVVRWNDLGRWRTETDFFVFVLLDGGFSWGMRLLGFEDFMVAVARDAVKIQSMVRDVEAFNSTLIRKAASQGAHGIVLADDIAHGSGLMIPPESLRRLFFPSIARQAELARSVGLSVFFHSDGNLNSILDDLAHSGVDGLQCLEKAAGMDLDAVRKKYGDRLCLWGNLDPALLTAPLNPEELERQVSAIAATAAQGGVIFGTSSGLFKGMRPEASNTRMDFSRKKNPGFRRSKSEFSWKHNGRYFWMPCSLRLKFSDLMTPCFFVGAASCRDGEPIAAGCRSYKNEAFNSYQV